MWFLFYFVHINIKFCVVVSCKVCEFKFKFFLKIMKENFSIVDEVGGLDVCGLVFVFDFSFIV